MSPQALSTYIYEDGSRWPLKITLHCLQQGLPTKCTRSYQLIYMFDIRLMDSLGPKASMIEIMWQNFGSTTLSKQTAATDNVEDKHRHKKSNHTAGHTKQTASPTLTLSSSSSGALSPWKHWGLISRKLASRPRVAVGTDRANAPMPPKQRW